MKKYNLILVFIMVFIGYSSIVYSAQIPNEECTIDSDMISLYHFNQSSGDATDTCGFTDLNLSAGMGYTTTANGLWDQALNDTTASAMANPISTDQLYVLGSQDVTFAVWVYPLIFDNTAYVIGNYEGGLDRWAISLNEGGSKRIRFFGKCDQEPLIRGGIEFVWRELSINNWIHLAVTENASDGKIRLYGNGTLLGSAIAPLCTDMGSPGNFRLGSYVGDVAEGIKARFEDLVILNRTASDDDIMSMYLNNYSTGVPPPPPPNVSAPVVNLLKPLNNSLNNSLSINFTYNVTDSGGILTSCDLYTNETGTLQVTSTNNSPTNNSDNYFNNIVFTEGERIWNVQCTDNNSNSSFAANNFTFTIDTIPPTSVNDIVNDTIYFRNNITAQINLTDETLLHFFNISIDGVLIFNITHIHNKTFQYNLSEDIGSLSISIQHNLTYFYADGHTAEEVGEYIWKNGLFNDYLRYDFYGETYITTKEKQGSILDSWSTEKRFDRYIQIYKPFNPSDTLTFIEKSDSIIYIYNKPGKYNDYWIVFGNHWKDYVVEGEPDAKVSIKRINDYEVEVTISGIKNNPGRIILNSIGDLNVVREDFRFFRTNVTTTFTDPISELQTQTMTLEINTSHINSTAAGLIYNGSFQTIVKIVGATSDLYNATFLTPEIPTALNQTEVEFIWFWNITGLVNTENGNITQNQTVNKLLIDNCSIYITPAINFTMFREDTNTHINSSMDGYFEFWIEDIVDLKSFNLSWGLDHKHSLCISENRTYNIFAQLEYETNVANFDKKTYYITNATINSTTQLINLYLTPNTTAVTFTVTDQDDNELDDVYINILRYDFGTNSHLTSEIIKTDEQGDAIGNIVLTTQWYKFLLIKDGILLLETEPVKITSTSRNFRINLLTDYFDFYDIEAGILKSLTFTNSTGNFAYTFLNPTGISISACLKVIEIGAINEILVNETCISSSSGTILVNVGSDVTDKTYVATGSIQINPDFLTDVLTISFAEGYKKWGKDGILITFFVRLFFALVGLWNPVVAILLLLVGDIGMIMMGLFHMSWNILIVYIILGVITMWRVNRKQ